MFNLDRLSVDRYRMVCHFRLFILRKLSGKSCVLCHCKCIFRVIRNLGSCNSVIPSCEGISLLRFRSYGDLCILSNSCLSAACRTAFLSLNIYGVGLRRCIGDIELRYSHPAVVRFFCHKPYILNFLLIKVEGLCCCVVSELRILSNFDPLIVFICLDIQVRLCNLSAVRSASRCELELIDRIFLSKVDHAADLFERTLRFQLI